MTEHTTHTPTNEIPYGYCHCGCGQKTSICQENRPSRGLKKGEPRRFVRGHGSVHRDTRFWEKVDTRGPNDCWEWQGYCSEDGYGVIFYNGKTWKSHRLSYFLHTGAIPDGILVCHRCDNPACVNPAHLFLGTRTDNNRDRATKGRSNPLHGGSSPNTKLTDNDALTIRNRHATGESFRALSRDYGVSTQAIYRIVHNKTFRHVK